MRAYLITAAAAAFAFASVTAAAQTQPPRPENPTVGDCISDGFYGNEPNIEGPVAPGGPSEQEPGTKGGRVVPSQSPGPKLNNPADPSNPLPGPSVGDANKVIKALPPSATPTGIRNLPQFCKTVVDAQRQQPAQKPRQ